MPLKKLAVFVSGGGSNMQAVQDAILRKEIPAKIALVISSNENAFALERAKKYNIPYIVINKKTHSDIDVREQAILEVLKNAKVDFCILAGYLSIIGENIIKTYPNKIINIHPALIPSFCGDGYYGLKVHQAVLDMGVKVTGATAHFVNEITDGGPIILQKPVCVKDSDTPEVLQKRVMEEAEWVILPKAVALLCNDKLEINGRIVRIKENGID